MAVAVLLDTQPHTLPLDGDSAVTTKRGLYGSAEITIGDTLFVQLGPVIAVGESHGLVLGHAYH